MIPVATFLTAACLISASETAFAQRGSPTPNGSRVDIGPSRWDRSSLTTIRLGHFANNLGEESPMTDHDHMPIQLRELSLPVVPDSALSQPAEFQKNVYWSPVEHSSTGGYLPADHWDAAKNYRFPRASFVYTSKKGLPRVWRSLAIPVGKIPDGLSVKVFLKVKDISQPDTTPEIFVLSLQMDRSEDWLVVHESQFKSLAHENKSLHDLENYQFEALGFAVTSKNKKFPERFPLRVGKEIEFRLSPGHLPKPSDILRADARNFDLPEVESVFASVDRFFEEQSKPENIEFARRTVIAGAAKIETELNRFDLSIGTRPSRNGFPLSASLSGVVHMTDVMGRVAVGLVPVETGEFAHVHGPYSHVMQVLAGLHGLSASEQADFVRFYKHVGSSMYIWEFWNLLFDARDQSERGIAKWRDLYETSVANSNSHAREKFSCRSLFH
jgi:hypothetical protein